MNNKGFSIFMLLIVVAIVAIAAVWFSIYSESAPPLDISKLKEVTTKELDVDTDSTFEDLPQDEYTPVEVNDEALEELDSIMNSIQEEDLSELSDL